MTKWIIDAGLWYDRFCMAWWSSMVAFRTYMKLKGPHDIGVQTLDDFYTKKPTYMIIIAIGDEAADLRKLLEIHGNFTKR